MTAPFHTERCILGEGAFWHPGRQAWFWLDILSRRLYGHEDGAARSWDMPEIISAIGWTDRGTLFLAGETHFWLFDIDGGTARKLVPLEADNPVTRPNDGRADPFGGFWIGTMGWQSEPGAGSFWRYYRGEVRQLFGSVSVPNATCFAPDGRWAYFTDTKTRVIRRVALDAEGWPDGEAEDQITVPDGSPDGAVVDAGGDLWVAVWGRGQVRRYGPDGVQKDAIDLPAVQVSCPAFGGPDLTKMLVTSAAAGLDLAGDLDGCTFLVRPGVAGQTEHRVIVPEQGGA